MNSQQAVSVIVYGRVQGVGFRYSTQKKAQSLKLTGYVSNEIDGSVSVYCEGSENMLSLFTQWLKKGPMGSSVSSTTVRKLKPKGCRVFEILY